MSTPHPNPLPQGEGTDRAGFADLSLRLRAPSRTLPQKLIGISPTTICNPHRYIFKYTSKFSVP